MKLQLVGRACVRNGIDIAMCNLYSVFDNCGLLLDEQITLWPIGNTYYWIDAYYRTTKVYQS